MNDKNQSDQITIQYITSPDSLITEAHDVALTAPFFESENTKKHSLIFFHDVTLPINAVFEKKDCGETEDKLSNYEVKHQVVTQAARKVVANITMNNKSLLGLYKIIGKQLGMPDHE